MDEARGLLLLLAIAAGLTVLLLTIRLVREARRPPRHTAGYALALGRPCDPGDLGHVFRSWAVDAPGRARLPLWEITPDLGGACPHPGLTAVIVHGWGQSRVDMLLRLDPWSALCPRVVLYDLRGHGDAEGGVSHLGHGEEEDLLRVLETLGSGPVILAAYSMGAVIAMHAAASGDPRAAGVIGIVAHGTYDDFHRSLRGRLRAAGLPARPLSDLAMLWFRACGLRHRSTRSAATAVDHPLLLVHGTRDDVAPLSHARRIVRSAGDAELYTVEGGAHSDTHLVDEKGLSEEIRRFAERAYALAMRKKTILDGERS